MDAESFCNLSDLAFGLTSPESSLAAITDVDREHKIP